MTWRRTVGLAVPHSGNMDAIGRRVSRGARLAAAELDAAGGGLELRVEDTGGDPDRARAVVESMAADGVPVVVGPISSDVALAVRDLAEERGIAHLPAMGGNPAVTRPGTRHTFRFSSSNEQSGRGVLAFFDHVEVRSFSVIAGDFSYPRAIVDVIEEQAPAYDLTLASTAFTPLGTVDFGPLVDDLDPDVDGLFLPYPGNGAVTLVRQLRERGYLGSTTVLGDYAYGSVPYATRLGDDVVGVNNWGVDRETERWADFDRRVRERFDEPAGVYHAFGYDVLQLAARALEAAGTADPEGICEALRALEYESVSGWGVSFNADGRNDRYAMVVNRWVETADGPMNRPVFRSDVIAP